MSGSSPPPAPDYAAAAEKTATGNLDLARTTTQANRVNTYTPYGNLTYTNGGTFDQAGYDAAMARYNTPTAAVAATSGKGPGQFSGGQDGSMVFDQGTPGTPGSATTGAMPDRKDFMGGNPDQWSAKVELAPEQQKLLDAQNRTSLGLAGLQDAATQRVASSMAAPFSLSGAPARAAAYGGTDAASTYSPTNKLPGIFKESNSLSGVNLADRFSATSGGGSANADSGELTKADVFKGGTVNTSKYYDPTRDTGVATDLLMSRANPALDRQEAAMRTRLSNMGLTPGSEAWNHEMAMAGQTRNDALMQASLKGIDLGMAQQGQTYSQTSNDAKMEMDRQRQINEQQIENERLRLQQFGLESGVELGNAKIAADSQTSQAANLLAAARLEMDQKALAFNQGTTNIGTGMAQQAQQFDQTGRNRLLTASEQAQQFSQAEALRSGHTQDALLERSQPLNELNAIRTGSQVSQPNFPTAPSQANVAGPNYANAANQQYGAAMDAFSANQASNNSMMAGAASVASIAAMAF